jgi:hypothetical protein
MTIKTSPNDRNPQFLLLNHQVFRLTTVTTRIVYKKGLKTLGMRI